jgi:hypothetical protein
MGTMRALSPNKSMETNRRRLVPLTAYKKLAPGVHAPTAHPTAVVHFYCWDARPAALQSVMS